MKGGGNHLLGGKMLDEPVILHFYNMPKLHKIPHLAVLLDGQQADQSFRLDQDQQALVQHFLHDRSFFLGGKPSPQVESQVGCWSLYSYKTNLKRSGQPHIVRRLKYWVTPSNP